MTHICVGKLTIIGSNNGLSPGRRQAIIWTNAGILLIRPLGTNFSKSLIGIQTFSLKKMHLKMSSAKWRPFRLGLNVLRALSCKSSFKCIWNAPYKRLSLTCLQVSMATASGPSVSGQRVASMGWHLYRNHIDGLVQERRNQCCRKCKILARLTDHPWLLVGWSVSVLGSPPINNLLRPCDQSKIFQMDQTRSTFY